MLMNCKIWSGSLDFLISYFDLIYDSHKHEKAHNIRAETANSDGDLLSEFQIQFELGCWLKLFSIE